MHAIQVQVVLLVDPPAYLLRGAYSLSIPCFSNTKNKKGSIREGGTTARRGRAGLSQAQCSAGGAVTRVASALMLFMTAVLRLPVF